MNTSPQSVDQSVAEVDIIKLNTITKVESSYS